MKKYYKNLTGKLLRFKMNGKIVEVPGKAKSIELEESVAKIMQGRTPVKILEEVEKEENPVVKEKDLNDLLKRELQALCDDKDIEYTTKDTKEDLIKKLRGE